MFCDTSFKSKGFQLASPVAVTFAHKYGGIIKDAVKRTKQGIVFAEIFTPLVWCLVVGKNHGAWTIFIIAAVDHIKEHMDILFIEHAPVNLINTQAAFKGFRVIHSSEVYSVSALCGP